MANPYATRWLVQNNNEKSSWCYSTLSWAPTTRVPTMRKVWRVRGVETVQRYVSYVTGSTTKLATITCSRRALYYDILPFICIVVLHVFVPTYKILLRGGCKKIIFRPFPLYVPRKSWAATVVRSPCWTFMPTFEPNILNGHLRVYILTISSYNSVVKQAELRSETFFHLFVGDLYPRTQCLLIWWLRNTGRVSHHLTSAAVWTVCKRQPVFSNV